MAARSAAPTDKPQNMIITMVARRRWIETPTSSRGIRPRSATADPGQESYDEQHRHILDGRR